MIICIDIGNTNIKYAIYDGDALKFSFRVATDFKKTSDEYGAQLTSMLAANDVEIKEIEGGIISSVVPQITNIAKLAAEKIIKKDVSNA